MALRDTLVPVRYFAGPEPYYFLPDNTPLTDLKQRDDQLADALDLLIPLVIQADEDLRAYLSAKLLAIGPKGPTGIPGIKGIKGEPGQDGVDSPTQGPKGPPGPTGTAYSGTHGNISGGTAEIGPYDWRNPIPQYFGMFTLAGVPYSYPSVVGEGGSVPMNCAIVGLRKPAESDGLYSRLYIRYRGIG